GVLMAEILAYVHKDGLFHRLHPFTKIAFVLFVCVMCIVSTSIPFLFFLVIALLALAVTGNLIREIVQQSKLIGIMTLLFFIITLLTIPGGDTFGYLIPRGIPVIGGAIPLTWGALAIGAILSLRFIVLILAFQIFLISTQPRDLVHTMERMKIPIDYILMFVIALRFIPTLQIEGKRIHEAQLARGYNPGSGLIGKVRSVAPIVIPLVSNALARANILGLTIDIRGFRTGTRTHHRERSFYPADYTALFLLGAAVVVFLWGSIAGMLT
ncbi:MAG: energy-coupling factor transporter transmembrane component T, partial [Methanoregulaceae archaeon]